MIDCFEAGRRRSSESEGNGEEAAIEQGQRKAVCLLIPLAALLSLLVGILYLMESVMLRTAGAGQLDLAAEGEPSHVEVTFVDAIQALGVRH